MWREILDYLARNKDSLSILVSIVVGIATLITSIVSIHVMMSQNRISQEQTDIQKSQIQPIFTIVVHQQQDFDDGKYGTDVLNVRNLGSKVLDYSVDVDVFSNCQGMKRCKTTPSILRYQIILMLLIVIKLVMT